MPNTEEFSDQNVHTRTQILRPLAPLHDSFLTLKDQVWHGLGLWFDQLPPEKGGHRGTKSQI